jgi:hypothetical protein
MADKHKNGQCAWRLGCRVPGFAAGVTRERYPAPNRRFRQQPAPVRGGKPQRVTPLDWARAKCSRASETRSPNASAADRPSLMRASAARRSPAAS